jgi:ABC-type transport system involved in Fe-S cluster assembly fused permease/ATPase subunit
MVPQDNSQFHRTLMENIHYARPKATDGEVWEAAMAAYCHYFISPLPEGFDTGDGDRGFTLVWRTAAARSDCTRVPEACAVAAVGRGDLGT